MNPLQMMQMVKMSRNPQMMIQTLMQTNPFMKQAMDYIQQNGGNPKEAFYKLAEEKGVNPDSVLNSLW